MTQLLSLLYFLYFFITAALLLSLSIFLLPFSLLFDHKRRLLHLLASRWGHHFLLLNPNWKCKFDGMENFCPSGTYVVVANHQSLADIFVLSGLCRPFKWVSKESLFKIPFFGWNMFLTKYIAIKRGSLSSVKQMMTECQHWLKQGESVMMFPEGTRSENGEIANFRDGSFRLSAQCNVPILPIVINGTQDIVPKHGRTFNFLANVKVKLLPPVFPSDFDFNCAKLKHHVEKQMRQTLAEMRITENQKTI